MRKLLLTGLILFFVSGCATTAFDGKSSIIITENSVNFEAKKPTKMTYKKDKDGNVEYTYDSQAPSLLSRILSAMTLGAVGSNR